MDHSACDKKKMPAPRNPGSKHPTNFLGVGLLVLLLSAVHDASGGASTMNPAEGSWLPHTESWWSSTPHLAYVASLVDDGAIDVSELLSGERTRRLVDGGGSSAAEEPEDPKVSSMVSERPVGVAVGAEKADSRCTTPALSFSSAADRSSGTDSILNDLRSNTSGSYAPTQELLTLTSDGCRSTTTSAAPGHANPLMGLAPDEFRWLPIPTDVMVEAHSADHEPTASSAWCCNYCNQTNELMAESCRHCREPNGFFRVFFGQQHKMRTASVVRFLMESMFPDIEVAHIEAHTNKHTGFGKGCAWVYVRGDDAVMALLTMHKRLLVCVDDEGSPGVWLCGDSDLARAGLAHYALQSRKQLRPKEFPLHPAPIERQGAHSAPVPLAPKPAPTASPVSAASGSEGLFFAAPRWPRSYGNASGGFSYHPPSFHAAPSQDFSFTHTYGALAFVNGSSAECDCTTCRLRRVSISCGWHVGDAHPHSYSHNPYQFNALAPVIWDEEDQSPLPCHCAQCFPAAAGGAFAAW